MVPYDAFFRKGRVGDHANSLYNDRLSVLTKLRQRNFTGQFEGKIGCSSEEK